MDVERLHARRLLSHVATAASSSPAQADQQQVAEVPARAEAPLSSLDATVITALSLILCGLVIVLAVHSVVRCAFRVTRRACHGVGEPSGGRTDAARERGSSSCQGGPRRTGGARRFRALLLPLVYSPEVELAGCGASECAICLTEFAPGERLRVLPLCNHGFHVKCIDRWLAARQTCPTCRRAPFAIPSLPQASLSEAAETVQTQFNVHTGHPAENNHLP